MILTDVGEIGVYYEGREMILRPSLYAMSKLGDKKEILEIYLRVMAGDLAYSLAFLLSEPSAWIPASDLTVNGGGSYKPKMPE